MFIYYILRNLDNTGVCCSEVSLKHVNINRICFQMKK